MLGQTFEAHDLLIVLFLVLLEGILSIDNALVLGLLARQLPTDLRRKALTYGLGGAFAFRIVAVISASYLLHWNLAKLLGGGYLIYISLRHFLTTRRPATPTAPPHRSFWATVVVIELTDIAFAVDSIVAAIGVVGPPPAGMTRHPKTWVVMLGGVLGVLVMRLAAIIFIKLLERFPRFELAAYLLVLIIGAKLVIDWMWLIDFQHLRSPAFWIFWLLMLVSFCVGFLPSGQPSPSVETAASLANEH